MGSFRFHLALGLVGVLEGWESWNRVYYCRLVISVLAVVDADSSFVDCRDCDCVGHFCVCSDDRESDQ